MSGGGGSSTSGSARVTLTGYKMAGLWNEIKLALEKFWAVHRGLIKYRKLYTDFRDKWGARPPRSDSEWLLFWQEFVKLEDALSGHSTSLLDVYNIMQKAAEEGLEVVRLNGIDDGVIEDPIAYQQRSLDRVKQLLNISNE